MLRKEDFPKEPIEILKDVLPSEEFKKLASLNQERLRCMAEADGLMGEVIEIESKLLVQLNKIRSIEAEIMLKSTSPKMQEADRACAYELINDSCIHESAEVRAYQAGLLPLRKEYPEQCHPSNKLVEAFKQYSRACEAFLDEPIPKGKNINEEVTTFLTQRKFDTVFRQAVNTIISDNSRETRLLEQEKTIEDCKNKLAASGMLLNYFACCGCGEDMSEASRVALANDISEKLFVNKSPEEEFWSLSAKDLFETLLMLLAQDCGSSNPVKEFYNLLAMTRDIQKLCNKLEQFSQSDKGQQFSKIIQRFLSNSEATKTGIVAHMNNQLLGFMRFDLV